PGPGTAGRRRPPGAAGKRSGPPVPARRLAAEAQPVEAPAAAGGRRDLSGWRARPDRRRGCRAGPFMLRYLSTNGLASPGAGTAVTPPFALTLRPALGRVRRSAAYRSVASAPCPAA